uniref:Uncharacterized protein n=1 Tax=Aegilops tauschii subsp. strangulata TaxID=200361 RepID=A0A453Q7V3_AEGTS
AGAPRRRGGVRARLHRGRPLGLPVPDRSIRAKLAAYEDLRRRLQDRVFALEEDLHAAARRIDLLKNESAMNAEGIRRCVEEKEAVAAARDQLAAHAARLEKECGLYERDLERAMESCDELARESDDLRNRLRDAPDVSNTTTPRLLVPLPFPRSYYQSISFMVDESCHRLIAILWI